MCSARVGRAHFNPPIHTRWRIKENPLYDPAGLVKGGPDHLRFGHCLDARPLCVAIIVTVAPERDTGERPNQDKQRTAGGATIMFTAVRLII